MQRNNLKGKVQTVGGLIDSNKMGITLPHEHLFIDITNSYMKEPKNLKEKKLVREKIELSNLWYARHHKNSCIDNMILNNENLAMQEVLYFKEAGGSTIVDMTCNNIGRKPEGLWNIAKKTDLNIIMGTSYYIAQSYTPEMQMHLKRIEDLAAEFINDIKVGIGKRNIKAGIIGEIGMSWPIIKTEKKVLQAAGIAQRETGAAINIHPAGNKDAPFEYIKILEKVGADLNHVAFSHMSRTFPIYSREERCKLAEKGCYLEYDMFGSDGIFPTQLSEYDVINDVLRIAQVIELIDDGFLSQILISQDVCYKVLLRAYGGGGYSHILDTVLPMMLKKGISKSQINTILIENPKRFISFH
jgi:phosphotriesterase-related protein